jgi:hypothetical protein
MEGPEKARDASLRADRDFFLVLDQKTNFSAN